MKSSRKFLIFYIILITTSIIFLYVEHYTHFEFFLHLAAIPLEVLLAVFIVERILEKHETKGKRRELMFIKSYLFRAELRSLFILNFEALKSPLISFDQIKKSSLDELLQMRKEAENIEYKSEELLEFVILEYVNKQDVWQQFMDRAIAFNFEEIVADMIYILHFIQDVKLFTLHNPGALFIHTAQQNQHLMNKVNIVLHDGIRKFLDYAIELKIKQPVMFNELLEDYEHSRKISIERR